jgi:hypothetical protein
MIALAAQPLELLIEPLLRCCRRQETGDGCRSVQVDVGTGLSKNQVATLRADVERAAVGVAYNRALGDF